MTFNLRNLVLPFVLGIPTNALLAAHLPASDVASASSAREVKYNGPLSIILGTRVDYQREYQKSEFLDEPSGFKGNNLMINIQGNITERFSYRYRQRISQTKSHSSFFDGTDFMWLQYNFNDRWDIRAGKVAHEFGNSEYQRDPSEQYVLSDFWNYPPCYKFGINLGYNLSANDRVVLQAAESSFRTKDNDTYMYSLSWYGHHNWFHNMYSVNVSEYRRGKFLYYLSFGNTIKLNKVQLNFDYMNRFSDKGSFWKDCTVRGEVMVRPNAHFNIIGLASYSTNQTHDVGPLYLPYGSEITRFGGFVEYSPIPSQDKTLKIHAGYSYGYGKEGVNREVPSLHRHLMSVGVQWEMDIVALAKKIFNKD